MTTRHLPPELVTLIEHVALNEAGWWGVGIQRFVLATIWLEGKPLHRDALPAAIDSAFGVSFSPAELAGPIDALVEAGGLRPLAEGKVSIPEEAAEDFDASLSRTLADDEEMEARVIAALPDADGTPERGTWDLFEEELLTPLLDELGARVYDVVTGRPPAVEETTAAETFLRHFPAAQGHEVLKAIADLLDPNDALVRRFLLRRLNAHFFIVAASLPDATLAALDQRGARQSSLAVFVDTNFLFSFLRLHDNPSNEAASSLLELIGQVRNYVDVKLYVLPITVDETRRVIRGVVSALSTVHVGPSVASATLKAVRSSSIVTRFLEAAAQHSERLSAAEFFDDYERDLVPILRQHGLELFNDTLDALRLSQPVIDDVLGQEEFQRAMRPRVKPYEANLHDVVLWHFVREKRTPSVSSPLEARYWALTVDFAGLLSFDRHKQRALDMPLPLCLHPAALTQMLQFWVPRDEALQRALVASFRLPFLRTDFDSAAEEVTMKILSRLSRYERIDDLTQETIGELLLNDALRGRIQSARSEDEEHQLIESAILDELMSKEQELGAERSRHEQVAGSLREEEARADALQQASASKDAEIDQLRSEVKRLAGAESRLMKLEADAEANRQRDQLRQTKATALWSLLLLSIACAGLGYIAERVLSATPLPPHLRLGAVVSTGALMLLQAMRLVTRSKPVIQGWWLTRAVGYLAQKVRSSVVALVLGVGSALLYDQLKDAF